MSDKINLPELLKTQISLTEWLEKSGHQNTEQLRVEDNKKRERLAVLNEIIGIPFDKPTQFPAIDVVNETDEFKSFLKEHAQELCALRLIPTDPNLPKLRMRGQRVIDVMGWFQSQNIDPEKYVADFLPHSDNALWSTIFIVNSHGIFGEITKGMHYQLTQGFYDEGVPIIFSYDYKNWTISSDDPKILDYVKDLISKIKVSDIRDREQLQEKLNSTFTNYYLNGYFESIEVKEFGLWFTDYNRYLGDSYQNTPTNHQKNPSTILSGFVGSPGKASGKVKIINAENLSTSTLKENEVLVCDMTTPDFVPLMQQASAIITNFGGILSHAAIVARELNIPCVTNTKTATQTLKDGDYVEVDATLGIIRYVD